MNRRRNREKKRKKTANLANLFLCTCREIICGRKFHDLKRVARRVRFRESLTVKIAHERRYARCVHISHGRSSLCMRRSSISSVSVSSHSMTQTRVPCRAFWLRRRKRSIIGGACMRNRLGFSNGLNANISSILIEGNVDISLRFANDTFPISNYWRFIIIYIR